MNFADVAANLAARRALFQPLAHTRHGRLIVAAIARIIDELGLVDDAVNLLMRAHEAEIGFEPDAFGADLVGRRLHQRRDMVAQLLAHIANERLEDFLLRIEIGVEAAERGSGAARDRADRRFVKAALAEFDRRGVEQLAQRPPPAFGARRLVARIARAFACFGPRLIHGCLSASPRPAPPASWHLSTTGKQKTTKPVSKLKLGSCFIIGSGAAWQAPAQEKQTGRRGVAHHMGEFSCVLSSARCAVPCSPPARFP